MNLRNQPVTFQTVTGEFVIGTLKDQNEEFITIENPYAVRINNVLVEGNIKMEAIMFPYTPTCKNSTQIFNYTGIIVNPTEPTPECIQKWKQALAGTTEPQLIQE